MKPISSLKYHQLCFFGKPKCDRAIYRLIKKNRVRSIVEFGLGNTQRTINMIRIAQKYCGSGQVRFTGIDLFEASPSAATPLELKRVHQQLAQLEAKIQLVPGALDQAIPRIANSHMRTDLIVISGDYINTEINACWSYFPRMLCATSVMMLQPQSDLMAPFQRLTRMEVERIVRRSQKSDRTQTTTAAA